MNALTPASLAILRADITAALATVAKTHGITIATGRCTYTGQTATFKLDIGTISGDGVAVTKEAESFTRNAVIFGLLPEDLGKSFVSGGLSFVVAGLKPASTKYPILARREDGKVFKFGEDTVKRLLGRASA